jgi:hypothetical protein
MEFVETYRHEVIQSRRDRARRALFWSRILGIVLMLMIGAVLRAEPELRRALSTAGSDAILAMMGHSAATPQAVLPKGADDNAVQISTRPRDRVKVNRPAQGLAKRPEFAADLDIEDLSRSVGAQLNNMPVRP